MYQFTLIFIEMIYLRPWTMKTLLYRMLSMSPIYNMRRYSNISHGWSSNFSPMKLAVKLIDILVGLPVYLMLSLHSKDIVDIIRKNSKFWLQLTFEVMLHEETSSLRDLISTQSNLVILKIWVVLNIANNAHVFHRRPRMCPIHNITRVVSEKVV
jgi:hypothetical protein